MISRVPSGSFLQRFEPVLDRLRAGAQSYFGVAEVHLTPVGHDERPFSFLLRVAVSHAGTSHPAGHAFLKVLKPKDPSTGIDLCRRVSRDFETTQAVYQFLSKWDDVGVVRPIVCYADLLAIVTEEVPGLTLLEYLQSHAKWWPSAARMADLEATMTASGLWLKRFQGFPSGDGRIALTSLLEYIDVRLRRLKDHHVINGHYRDRILRHLNHLAADVAPNDLREVSIHADLAPANMLVSGNRIVVLDFAMAGRGSYLHDISRLFLQLDVLRAKPQYRPHVVERLQAALLRGFDPGLTASHPLFRYLLMLHRINHLGTLALRRERFPASILSVRVQQLHRQWIERELAASEGLS
jgi:tRNA A-37 threonylcarbamoyl transferase component Bud32